MRSTLNTLTTLVFLATSGMASAQDPAQVATLNKAEGTVMVDKGKGFVSSKADAVLNEGDRVITLSGSAAEIVFADGCKALLKANNMMTIALNPGCKAPIVAVNGATGAGSAVPLSRIAIPVLASGVMLTAVNFENDCCDNKPISAE